MDALIGKTLTTEELIRAALAAESKVSGRHADNVIPALVGGIVLIRSLEDMECVSLSVPPSLHIVIVHPAYRVSTQDARRALPEWVDRPTTVHQMAQVGAIVHALADRATSSCSAARWTTGSPSRRARRCCPASPTRSGRRWRPVPRVLDLGRRSIGIRNRRWHPALGMKSGSAMADAYGAAT